jgi:N-acetylglucosamine-6-phosphate deacetylase
MDAPPGEYLFGPPDGGEVFYNDGEVGLTVDRTGLASSVRGMDFMVRHMVRGAGVDLATAVRMASLTPATILGLQKEIGSIAVGKRADLLVLDEDLRVVRVFVDGREAELAGAGMAR